MEKKTDEVRRLVREGNYHSALGIASDFRIGISREDSAAMKRGFESDLYPEFYRSIGMNPVQLKKKGIETLIRLYG